MKSIKEKAEKHLNSVYAGYDDVLRKLVIEGYVSGANYVLDILEEELTRRMLEDYNQGAEEDEVAQGCMATMIMFVRQLKK